MQIDVFRADANITEQKNCSIYLYGDLVVKHVGQRFVNKKILRFKSYLLTFFALRQAVCEMDEMLTVSLDG